MRTLRTHLDLPSAGLHATVTATVSREHGIRLDACVSDDGEALDVRELSDGDAQLAVEAIEAAAYPEAEEHPWANLVDYTLEWEPQS